MAYFLGHAPDVHTGAPQAPRASLSGGLDVIEQGNIGSVLGRFLGGGEASTAPTDDNQVVGIVVVGGA